MARNYFKVARWSGAEEACAPAPADATIMQRRYRDGRPATGRRVESELFFFDDAAGASYGVALIGALRAVATRGGSLSVYSRPLKGLPPGCGVVGEGDEPVALLRVVR